MKTATIIGWHGKLNIGDDIMLEVITEQLIQNGIDRVSIWCTKDHYQTNPYRDVFFFENETSKLHRVLSRLKSLSSNSLLIIGGGSILHSSYSVFWKLLYACWVRVFNPKCKIYMIGISYGPFKSRIANRLGEVLLNVVDRVVVRESSTFNMIKKKSGKVKCGFDLAVLHPTLTNESIALQEKTKSIAVSVKGSGDQYSRSILDRIAKALEAVNSVNSLKVDIVVLCSDKSYGDIQASEYLARNLSFPVEIKVYDGDVRGLVNVMKKYDLHIATRLHGQIIASFLNKKLIPISYHPKCDDMLKEMGYGEMEILRIYEFSSENLRCRITDLIDQHEYSNRHFEKDALFKKAQINFKW